MYGSYHHITLHGRKGPLVPTAIAGPLCESGDVFTRDAEELIEPRLLPEARPSGRRKPTLSTPATGSGQPMMVAPCLPTSSTRWVRVAPQNLPRDTTMRCPGRAASTAAWMVG
jgi:hypothetical protein